MNMMYLCIGTHICMCMCLRVGECAATTPLTNGAYLNYNQNITHAVNFAAESLQLQRNNQITIEKDAFS